MPVLLNLTELQKHEAGTEILTNAEDLNFLQTILTEHLNSEKVKDYAVADEYYRNRNVKIKEKHRFIYLEDKKEIIHTLSNTQTAHAFMKKLVNQKASYLLGKPFSFTTEQNNLADRLEQVFNKKFYRKLLKVGKDSIKYGIGWLQVYYDESGNLDFKRVSPAELIPFWKDGDHEELEAMMKTYTRKYYSQGGSSHYIRKIEYYDKTGVYYFEIKDGKFIPDTDKPSVFSGHFTLNKEVINPETNEKVSTQEEQVWLQVPFIPYKANDDEFGILTFIKDLIDDYDKNDSDVSDQLQDVPNAIKVVKGYVGEDKEEFAHNINVYRTIFVDEAGEVSSVQTSIDVAALDSHLNRLRKDIYEFGGGVDSQKDEQNIASGVSLKFRYADLDLDAKFMATEFSSSMEKLIWFICADMTGRGEGEFDPEEVEVVWNTDMAIAESEVIANINNSSDLLSKKTLIANHPWVKNVNEEMKLMEEQKKKEVEEYGNLESGTKSQAGLDEEDDNTNKGKLND